MKGLKRKRKRKRKRKKIRGAVKSEEGEREKGGGAAVYERTPSV